MHALLIWSLKSSQVIGLTLLTQILRAEARAVKFAARADATGQEERLRSSLAVT